MRTEIIHYRNHVLENDIKILPLLTQSTGFFNAEEVDIVEELVTETLTKPDSGYLWQVAEIEGVTAGFTCFGRIPGSEHSWDLYWIVVGKEFQGFGLGKKLISTTEEFVRAQGGKLLIAETSGKPQYESTRQFYLRCSYLLEATIQDFYAPNDDKNFFIKRL
jgi:GNAT superfamily N-acetyltransferase